jgi:hypothetical protein
VDEDAADDRGGADGGGAGRVRTVGDVVAGAGQRAAADGGGDLSESHHQHVRRGAAAAARLAHGQVPGRHPRLSGEIEYLRSINTDNVLEVRYFDPIDASSRFGRNVPFGAIQITLDIGG